MLQRQSFPSLMDVIGHTPLVRLVNMTQDLDVEVVAKLEYLNPSGSTKDRPIVAMVEEAEEFGVLRPGGTIIDSSSGNFAVAMAMVGAAKRYNVICVVDPNLPDVTAKIIRSLGAQLEFVDDADEAGSYLLSRLKRRDELIHTVDGAWCPNQYQNPTSAKAHYLSTGSEIVADVNHQLDAIVIAAGTCCTLTGCARIVKERIPNVRVIAVDAVGSMIFHHRVARRLQKGVGSSLTADQLTNLDLSVIDEVRFVSDEDAFMTARSLAKQEGILAGGSSGTALFGALTVARELSPGSRVATIFPDRLERYLSDHQSDEWMEHYGFDTQTTTQAVWNAVDRWLENAACAPRQWKRVLTRSAPSRFSFLSNYLAYDQKGMVQ